MGTKRTVIDPEYNAAPKRTPLSGNHRPDLAFSDRKKVNIEKLTKADIVEYSMP